MQIPIFTVDAFTSRSFSGNPAAVCLLENDSACKHCLLLLRSTSAGELVLERKERDCRPASQSFTFNVSGSASASSLQSLRRCFRKIVGNSARKTNLFCISEVPQDGSISDLNEDLHQKIATEMNLSETAFIRKLHSVDDFTKSSCFGLRWFTPTNEVPLCGHATLAAAAVLFHIQKNKNAVLTFVTLSGELKARQAEDHIVLDLPLYLTYPQVFQEVGELIKAAIGDMIVQDLRYSPDTKKLLVRLSDTYERSVLEELQVSAQDFLSAEKTGKVKGLILTLKGDSSGKHKGYDFYSRYFAPWIGVLEDPVTGSAHAVLSSYWSEQLGKKEMLAFQCSHRGGELKISLRNDGRVDIAGQIAIVLKGNLTF